MKNSTGSVAEAASFGVRDVGGNLDTESPADLHHAVAVNIRQSVAKVSPGFKTSTVCMTDGHSCLSLRFLSAPSAVKNPWHRAHPERPVYPQKILTAEGAEDAEKES